MKKFLIFCLLIVVNTQTLYSQVRVSGYTRKNGTYVQPHMRSSPNSNPYDNYSFPGNTNPYTGKTSTGNSDTYLYNYYNKSNITGISSINNYPLHENNKNQIEIIDKEKQSIIKTNQLSELIKIYETTKKKNIPKN
jgi:hypothetical protein